MLLFAGGPEVRADTNPVAMVIAALNTAPYNPPLLARLKASLATLPSREDRCAPGVIYCLGCLASGQTAEGTTTRGQILKAYAGNPAIDALADERIADPCPRCDRGGIGGPCAECRRSDPGTCAACGGTGVRSSNLGGTTAMTVKRIAPDPVCKACRGTGRCPACGGRGTITTRCRACAGVGAQVSRAKCQVAYLQLLRAYAPPASTPPASVEQERPVAGGVANEAGTETPPAADPFAGVAPPEEPAETEPHPTPAPDPARYRVTARAYDGREDPHAAVRLEFGPAAELADWNEIKAQYGGSIEAIRAFCDAIGLPATGTDSELCLFVAVGDAIRVGGDRRYFLMRQNGAVPAGFLVHDDIQSNYVALGSWPGRRRILAKLAEPDHAMTAAQAGAATTHVAEAEADLPETPAEGTSTRRPRSAGMGQPRRELPDAASPSGDPSAPALSAEPATPAIEAAKLTLSERRARLTQVPRIRAEFSGLNVRFWDGGLKCHVSSGSGTLRNDIDEIIADGAVETMGDVAAAVRGRRDASFFFDPTPTAPPEDTFAGLPTTPVANVALGADGLWRLLDDHFMVLMVPASLGSLEIAMDKSVARASRLTLPRGVYQMWGQEVTVQQDVATVTVTHGEIAVKSGAAVRSLGSRDHRRVRSGRRHAALAGLVALAGLAGVLAFRVVRVRSRHVLPKPTTPRDLIFECPHCTKALAIDEAKAGKTCACSDCQRAITIPAPATRFSCPACARGLSAPAALIGSVVRCSNCQADIPVPLASHTGGGPQQQNPQSAPIARDVIERESPAVRRMSGMPSPDKNKRCAIAGKEGRETMDPRESATNAMTALVRDMADERIKFIKDGEGDQITGIWAAAFPEDTTREAYLGGFCTTSAVGGEISDAVRDSLWKKIWDSEYQIVEANGGHEIRFV